MQIAAGQSVALAHCEQRRDRFLVVIAAADVVEFEEAHHEAIDQRRAGDAGAKPRAEHGGLRRASERAGDRLARGAAGRDVAADGAAEAVQQAASGVVNDVVRKVLESQRQRIPGELHSATLARYC